MLQSAACKGLHFDIDQAIGEKIGQYGTGNVLVVMDIDNTILTADTDLGSNE